MQVGSLIKLKLQNLIIIRFIWQNIDVVTEMVPTERAVMFRFTFPENDSYVVVDAFDRAHLSR